MSTRVSRVQNNSGNSAIARVQISPCVPRNDDIMLVELALKDLVMV